MGEDRSEAMTAWLQRFVSDAATEERVAHFVTQVDDEVLRRSPEVARDAMLVADLQTARAPSGVPSSSRSSSASTGWCSLTRRSPSPAPWRDATGTRRAPEDLPGRPAGHLPFLTDLTAGLKPGDPSRDPVLVGVWSRADRWMDEVIEQLITVYSEERQRLPREPRPARRRPSTRSSAVGPADERRLAGARTPCSRLADRFRQLDRRDTHGRPDAAHTIASAAAEALGTSTR